MILLEEQSKLTKVIEVFDRIVSSESIPYLSTILELSDSTETSVICTMYCFTACNKHFICV